MTKICRLAYTNVLAEHETLRNDSRERYALIVNDHAEHPMEIPHIVSMYIDAFCRQDVDACLATFAPDGTYSDPSAGQPLSGSSIKDHFAALFAGFPDATTETVALHEITAELVVWRWVIRGTNTGIYRGLPPTGRSIILHGCEFIEVGAAKVQRIEGYFDRLGILQQLGLVPAPGQAS